MYSIHKYHINQANNPVTIRMPKGAHVLHVDCQHGDLCMWAQVPLNVPLVTRKFVALPTGAEFLESDLSNYIGTIHIPVVEEFWHIYELFNK